MTHKYITKLGNPHAGRLVRTCYWWKVEYYFPLQNLKTILGTSGWKMSHYDDRFSPIMSCRYFPIWFPCHTPKSILFLSLNCLSRNLLTCFVSVGDIGHTNVLNLSIKHNWVNLPFLLAILSYSAGRYSRPTIHESDSGTHRTLAWLTDPLARVPEDSTYSTSGPWVLGAGSTAGSHRPVCGLTP